MSSGATSNMSKSNWADRCGSRDALELLVFECDIKRIRTYTTVTTSTGGKLVVRGVVSATGEETGVETMPSALLVEAA